MLLSLLLIIFTQTQPAIHAVHFIPGDVPHVVITGRDLWVGTEGEAVAGKRNTVSINGTIGEWDGLTGASGNDANRGLYCVQRVWFPRGLEPASSATLEFTRYDGEKTSRSIFIPINRGRRTGFTSGRRAVVDVPIVVRDGQTFDLEGSEIIVSGAFSGSELIRYGRGSTIRNGRLLITEDSKAPITAVMRSAYVNERGVMPATFGLHIDGLEIIDLRRRGVGIDTGSFRSSFIGHSKIVAWRSMTSSPRDESQENIFYHVEFTSPVGCADGEIGRPICGQRNLVWRCSWHDIDRGPTGGCWGSPLEQTTWFECSQYNTGHSQGASEGLLYEAYEALQATAKFDGTVALIEGVSTAPSNNWNQLRVGYYLARTDGRWARITSIDRQQNATRFTVKLDRPIHTNQPGDSIGDVRIGNGIIENNFIRCRFENGKSGIFLFGLALDNYLGGCQFADLRGGIVQLQRRATDGWSFGVNTTDRINAFRRVDQPWVTIPDSTNWPPRG